MTVRYLRKATGVMTATARVPSPASDADGVELHAIVEVRDASDEIVFGADITMWITLRKAE
jgi:hypothetical protein